jgi:hypothetical protein
MFTRHLQTMQVHVSVQQQHAMLDADTLCSTKYTLIRALCKCLGVQVSGATLLARAVSDNHRVDLSRAMLGPLNIGRTI